MDRANTRNGNGATSLSPQGYQVVGAAICFTFELDTVVCSAKAMEHHKQAVIRNEARGAASGLSSETIGGAEPWFSPIRARHM